MNTRLFLLLTGLFVALCAKAQVAPKPGAKLNYTQVMFECEKVSGAGRYIFELTYDTPDASFKHPLLQQKDSATATLVSGLQFGKKYQWRYAGLKKGEKPVWHGPYRFEIAVDSLLHYNLVHFDVKTNETGANAGGLIINDCTHSIVDRKGNLVWYLPKVNWHMVLNKRNFSARPQIFDLRLNPAGTITYLADSIAVECDLNGKRLWKAPNDGKVSGATTESYNHSFKRLPNGDYLILGSELWRKLPAYKDTASIIKKYRTRRVTDGKEYAQVEFPTVIEYDKRGKVVWSWNSESYFDSDALAPAKDTTRLDNVLNPHGNAVSIDKNNEFVYVGFRNISRIVKIEKKTGKVVDSWGNKLATSAAAKYVPIHQQHDADILDDGEIAVFNNNDYPGQDSFASVVIIKQQATDSNYVAWKFDCNFDSLDRHAERNGGNVDRLKNNNYLVCMGNMNRIFEVTPNKKIVWSAILTPQGKTGNMFFHRLYRAHYVSSLYPCYFTLQINDDTLKSGYTHVSFKIFNKGSESDAYNVRIFSGTGSFIKQFTTSEIAANRSVSFDIAADQRVNEGDIVMLEVSSKTNPDFDRQKMLMVAK